jgi:hypothetical protein
LILPCARAATAVIIIRVAIVAILDTGDHGITTGSVTPLLLDPVHYIFAVDPSRIRYKPAEQAAGFVGKQRRGAGGVS